MPDVFILAVLLAAAMVSALNPGLLGMVILVVTSTLGHHRRFSSMRMFLLAKIFLISVLAVYFIAGVTIVAISSSLPLIAEQYAAYGIGLLLIVAGLIEIKDYFWYGRGRGMRPPVTIGKNLHLHAKKDRTVFSTMALGAKIAVFSLPFAGLPLLCSAMLFRSDLDSHYLLLLAIYCLIVCLPIGTVIFSHSSGSRLARITRWKEANKRHIRYFSGLVLVVLGWIIIMSTNGVVAIG